VKRAAEIVETDNQLSAMRKINREYITTDKKIQKEVFSFSSNFDVSINYAFSFGNVKEEIVKYIKDYKPDVIVLGKRKKNPLSIIGDNVTQFIMKNHKGAIMIASEKEILEPNQPISLGLLNEKERKIL